MKMDKVLLGDNQFFAVNHLSDEKSRAQAIQFKDDSSIIRVLTRQEKSELILLCVQHMTGLRIFAIICVLILKNIRILKFSHACLMHINMQMQ